MISVLSLNRTKARHAPVDESDTFDFHYAYTNVSSSKNFPPKRITMKFPPLSLLSLLPFAFIVSADAGTVAYFGDDQAMPTELQAAVTDASWDLLPQSKAESEADVYIVNQVIDDALAQQLTNHIEAGKSVFIAMPKRERYQPNLAAELIEQLPVYNFGVNYHKRYATRLQLAEGATLATETQLPQIEVSGYYDVYLPYAPTNNGLRRYFPDLHKKDLFNTDWTAELTATDGARMPILISGRYGAAQVYLLGTALDDPLLLASPGFAPLLQSILDQADMATAQSNHAGLDQVELSIEHYQPEGIELELFNAGSQTAEGIVSFKVYNWAEEVKNAASLPITLQANERRRIEIPTVHPQSEITAPTMLDADLPYVQVEAGLLSADRTELFQQTSRKVMTAAPLQIQFLASEAAMEVPAPDRGIKQPDGKDVLDLVREPGAPLTFRVKLDYALLNLAPLATASDLGWEENNTAGGLNDLAVSTQFNQHLPTFAGWSGRQQASHQLQLEWPEPVLIGGMRLVGLGGKAPTGHPSNPSAFALSTSEAATQAIVSEEAAAFDTDRNGVLADYSTHFAPVQTQSVALDISGRDAKAKYTPAFAKEGKRTVPTNTNLIEWEMLGWPGSTAPDAVEGSLKVVAHNLNSGTSNVVLEQALTLKPFSSNSFEVELADFDADALAVIRLEAVFESAALSTSEHIPLVIAEPAADALVNFDSEFEHEQGFFTNAGFMNVDDFGVGHQEVNGWISGRHTVVWSLTHNLTEKGTRNRDHANRLFTTDAFFNFDLVTPFRNFPDGESAWTWNINRVLEKSVSGEWKGTKSVLLVGSDRWIRTRGTELFGWNTVLEFDDYLKETQGEGLQSGKTLDKLYHEIENEYGLEYQQFHFERFSKMLIDVQERFAEAGIKTAYTAHAGPPTVGGKAGRDFAKVYQALGFDIYWNSKGDDPVWAVGENFAPVAMNPDFSTKITDWSMGIMADHKYWWGISYPPEMSANLIFTAYFLGKVNTSGTFEPFYKYYSPKLPYGFGSKHYPADNRILSQLFEVTDQIRPQKAAGLGLVLSWPAHLSKVDKKLPHHPDGGVNTSNPEDSATLRMAHTHTRLAKSGLPISFFTATDALEQWDGQNPLVLIDGHLYTDAEIKDIEALNQAGAPIIAIADASTKAYSESAAAFFHASPTANGWQASADAETIAVDGAPLIIQSQSAGRAPTVFITKTAKDWTGAEVTAVRDAVLSALGEPIQVSEGTQVVPFINRDQLFLTVVETSLTNRQTEISIKPNWFLGESAATPADYRVVDVMDSSTVPSTIDADGTLHLSLPMHARSGKLLLLAPAK